MTGTNSVWHASQCHPPSRYTLDYKHIIRRTACFTVGPLLMYPYIQIVCVQVKSPYAAGILERVKKPTEVEAKALAKCFPSG